ncbi:MAG: cytochrome C oxidase subunit IV family protein [Myxococcota bacterium]|nr:cytochrome C oxidase subunit IV family protein [Myxococcota bacterium]
MRDILRFALRQRTTVVWLLLVGATLFSWAVGAGEAGNAPGDPRWLAALLVAVAFFKVRLVIRHFMEVSDATAALRWVTDAWCVVVATAIVLLYTGALAPGVG